MSQAEESNSFTERIAALKARIDTACNQYGKHPEQIKILAVSKTFPASSVKEALAAGLHAFGENYVQEGVEKIQQLIAHRRSLEWHFIGPLQSNKTKEVAEHFDWMHSVDREKIARRLSEQRPPGAKPLQVCVQVNVSGENSKSGVMPSEASALALSIASLPNLTLRGLMAIPEPTEDEALQRSRFAELTRLFQEIRVALPAPQQAHFDTLSMGMSADLEAAIAESLPQAATMVRIGTALFGVRPTR
ncbi:MAG: YggS family pyridoxal phosphate-dependent enzyme [Betaproteobacteria bacterium]|nr:YggS family pyridoxal phosphate-dependent enzyme [Betaproteobacteria bacterium]